MSKRKLPDVSNVAAGATATIRVPTGPTYDRINLVVGAAAGAANLAALLAAFTAVRVLINGRVIQEYPSLTVLDDINSYHGRIAASGSGTQALISLHFRRPEVKSFGKDSDGISVLSEVQAERVTSIRTGDVDTFTVEMTAAPGLTTPTIQAFSEEADGIALPLGFMTKIRRHTYNPAGASDFEISDWTRGGRLMAIHVQKADATVVTIKANNSAVIDAITKTVLQRMQVEEGRVPVAGYTVVDFIGNGDLDGALVTAGLRDLRTTLTLGSGGATNVFLEYLDVFQGI